MARSPPSDPEILYSPYRLTFAGSGRRPFRAASAKPI